MEILHEPWPWYIGGPAIAIVMFILISLGKELGISANLRTLVSLLGGGKFSLFFKINWKDQAWNLVFIVGTIAGAWFASEFMRDPGAIQLSPATLQELKTLGIPAPEAGAMEPAGLFTFGNLSTLQGILMLVVGGFCVGFGAPYAGGCTSGHAISGLSNLQLPSLVAVMGFFAGGLFITFVIYPLIF